MSSFAPRAKKAKRSADNGDKNSSSGDFFPGIGTIQYNPNAGPTDVMCYKHYNAKEVIHGKTMEDWLRFSVCYWHTFRGTGADPFGFPTLDRPWDDGSNSLENAKKRLRVAFEFFSKLGIKYWTFHDRDIAPEGETLEETNKNLDELTDLAQELMKKTGVKLLWNTCNLFAHPRYMNGASTNPDAHVFAYAAAQVKKGLEIGKKLGAENFVFWGGREGYHTILNTDVLSEMNHMAKFFRMVVAYKKKIGFTGTLLIEPKPKEPAKHQYDYDAMTVIGFLKHYQLDNDFKLNIEPNHTTLAGHGYEHDIVMASAFGLLGSIDSNTGSPDLGWDTDQFPMDVKNTTLVMKTVLAQGGLNPGGLNFDAKVRRESTALQDMFIAHIGAMDSFARGLRNAIAIIEDGVLPRLVEERYSSYKSGIGAKIEKEATSLEELEEYILENGEPEKISGHQEKYETILNHYV
ncbi:xylose isomerase-like [Glandiceps talaboti]